MRGHHRPSTRFKIDNVVKKNKFILTQAEYDACCKIAAAYREYSRRKAERGESHRIKRENMYYQKFRERLMMN